VFQVLLAFGALVVGCAAQTSSVHSSNPAVDSVLTAAEQALQSGNLDEALAKYQEALKLDPRSARAYHLGGNIALQRRELEQAKQALLESVKLDPSVSLTHIDLGKIYVLLKQWRPAAQEFQTARKLGDTTGAAEFGWGLALAGESRPSEALPHLAAAVHADPKDPGKLFTLINNELQLKQAANAMRHVEELEKFAPRDPGLLYRISNLLKEHDLFDEAEVRLERAADLLGEGENSPPAHPLSASALIVEIAQLRFEQHDYIGALQELEKFEPAKADVASQVGALEVEGGAWLAAGKFDQAQRSLRQASALDPSKPDHFLRWTWAVLMAGDVETAKSMALMAKNRWPETPEAALLLAVVERERLPERARVPLIADWHLNGDGMVCCPCTTPCPCRSNGHPTQSHCENTGVFRIKEGHYGSISLRGFTFVTIDARMGEQNIPQSVYVDSSASDEQLIALERIYQTFQPLRPFVFLDLKRVPLALTQPDEKTYRVNVPGLLELKIRRNLDSRGEPLLKTAALDYFANRLEYSNNLIYKVWNPDGSLRWDYSGRQANFRRIDVDARNYRERTMLVQYADGSGSFNKKQLALIRDQKLPTLPSSQAANSAAAKK
jgi:Tfp pilus assembly protein PilF